MNSFNPTIIQLLGKKLFYSSTESAKKLSDDLAKNEQLRGLIDHESTRYQMELLIFVMFPIDLLFHRYYKEHRLETLKEVNAAFVCEIIDFIEKGNSSSTNVEQLSTEILTHVAKRFKEYHIAFSQKQEGFEGYGLLEIGITACKNILETSHADAIAATNFAMHLSAIHKAMQPVMENISMLLKGEVEKSKPSY